jgi:hypothetical protein
MERPAPLRGAKRPAPTRNVGHAKRVDVAAEQLEERLRRLDEQLSEISQEEPYKELVGRLRCFHGIDTVTAMVLLAEHRRQTQTSSLTSSVLSS